MSLAGGANVPAMRSTSVRFGGQPGLIRESDTGAELTDDARSGRRRCAFRPPPNARRPVRSRSSGWSATERRVFRTSANAASTEIPIRAAANSGLLLRLAGDTGGREDGFLQGRRGLLTRRVPYFVFQLSPLGFGAAGAAGAWLECLL